MRRIFTMGRFPCCSKQGLNRGAWTKTEDMILSEYIRNYGDGEWTKLSKKAGLKRCGKSCRLRWTNYLRPDIKRGNISPDEEDIIVRMHRLLGNRWSLIAGRLPGRTDNEIKNYWNTCLRRKTLSVNKNQSKSNSQNLESSSDIPSPALPSHVFKTQPVKPAAVIYSEILRSNRCTGYGPSDCRSEEPVKLCNVKESTNSSTDYDRKTIDFEMADVNLLVTKAGNYSCSIWNLEEERTLPDSYCCPEDTATFFKSLLGLNRLPSPDCNLLSSPVDCSTDFEVEEFYE